MQAIGRCGECVLEMHAAGAMKARLDASNANGASNEKLAARCDEASLFHLFHSTRGLPGSRKCWASQSGLWWGGFSLDVWQIQFVGTPENCMAGSLDSSGQPFAELLPALQRHGVFAKRWGVFACARFVVPTCGLNQSKAKQSKANVWKQWPDAKGCNRQLEIDELSAAA